MYNSSTCISSVINIMTNRNHGHYLYSRHVRAALAFAVANKAARHPDGGACICEDTDIWLCFRAGEEGEVSIDNTSVEDALQPYAAF